MRQVGRATRLAAASTLLLVLTACPDVNEPGNGPTATPTTASATPTVTETPFSDEEVAARAAEPKVREYHDVRSRLGQDPTTPLRLLRSLATSVELDAQQRLFQNERSEGLVRTGQTRVAELVVQSVDLDNSDKKAGRVPTAQVDVCYDVSEMDVVDQDGKSTIRSTRALSRGLNLNVGCTHGRRANHEH